MELNAKTGKTRLLMLSRDPKMFENGSDVRNRMLEYAKNFDELNIIVFSKTAPPVILSDSEGSLGDSSPSVQNDKKLHLYPAKSLFDMYKIGKRILSQFPNFLISQFLITSQDPFETGLIGYLLKRGLKRTKADLNGHYCGPKRTNTDLNGQTGPSESAESPSKSDLSPSESVLLELQVHTDFLSPYFWKESLKNKVRVLIAKYLIPKADKIRVVSERIKKSIQDARCKIQDARIEVRPIQVDIEKIKSAPIKTDLHKKYPGKFIILMASRLTKEKNIGLAIAAVAEIKKLRNLEIRNESSVSISQFPNFLLLIAGDGPEKEKLKLLVASHKLQKNVVFEPHTDDLVSYYKTADLFLLTSNYEGYGRTVVEAQAAGLPVIMTDVGVAIGTIVPVGDKTALAAALEKKINNFKIQ